MKMNTDCTKPSVAPKPRFVCHASLKLPSPLMSAGRGPKPFIAPKPKVTLELNGREPLFFSGGRAGCTNGSSTTSDGEPDEEAESDPNKATADRLKQPYNLGTQRRDLHNVSAEEKDDDVIQKMDEDWRLTDSAVTEEPDSLETLWVSDAGLTTDSEDAVEMIDTDLTEDMDEDAGEALADTEGLSMGDISVNSLDEDAAGNSADKQPELGAGRTKERTEIKDGDSSECDGISQVYQTGEVETSGSDSRITSNILKVRCGLETKCENLQPCSITEEEDVRLDAQEELHNTAKRHVALEDGKTHAPYYIASEDIINREMFGKNNKSCVLPQSPRTPHRLLPINPGGASAGKYEQMTGKNCASLEDYVEITNGRCGNLGRTGLDRRSEDQKVDVFLNHLYCQPRFRFLCNSSNPLSSSHSENQLISPNDSDVFSDEDLEGHIVPFLDDSEQDFGDEHIYEDPGHSSEGENVFPFNRRTPGGRSLSLSQRADKDLVQKLHKTGFGQMGPQLSSSPRLSTTQHKGYAKPHYLALYPRSLSVEGQDSPLCVHRDMEGSPRQRNGLYSSGRFSRCSPMSSSGLSTPTSVVDIPPPFELAYITKRPITKSSPSLLIEGDSPEKNRKKKSSLKRFLMLKFKRKTESKPAVDLSPTSFKPSIETNHHTSNRVLDLDRRSISSSPRLSSHSGKPPGSPEPASSFLFYKDSKRKGSSVAFLNRSVVRVESFEDRSRAPFVPLPLTKPRSISFPNTDTSDYENVPPISSDYENLQVPQRRPVRQPPFSDFFDRPARMLSSANETDGYVDMSSLPGFESKTQSPEQEAESAYTEAYNVCSVAIAPQAGSSRDVRGQTAADEEQGRTSEEEDGVGDSNYDKQPDGRSRAFYVAKELVDTERLHVKALKLLQEDFREAVGTAVGDEGEPVLEEERLWEILNELPDVYSLHRRILAELENRIRQWEESQRIADIFLSRKAEFLVFTTYIGHYDRSMNLLEESCRNSPAFAAIVHQFEQSPAGEKVSLQYQLLQVIVRVAQYRMLLTDYLNNLSPDSKEYEDTQAAVVIASDIADQVNDSLKHGENLLRLVNIEYSVRGQRDLLQPGRVFVKEGTLMKVSRKSRQPRHLFLMNDVLLYTYPQQDGKYRLKNSLSLTGMKVSKPVIENIQNALRIEATDISITLAASSFLEREDWFYILTRTVTEHNRGSDVFNGCSGEARNQLQLTLGEKAPTLVPVSQVMMCMNCTSDFSLTLRRHHCHGCGRIVCRSCSKNRYPLKYMKGRPAKVCDHCYNELKKRGDEGSALASKNSPRASRSSRPLSAVFQNIHPPNIWRHKRGTLYFNQEKVASETLPLLGFTVKLPDRHEGEDEANVFQLYHKNTLYYTFRAEDNFTAQRWVNAMEEATVL